MTDRDNITLPREVVQEAVKALEFAERNHDGEQSLYTTEIAALRKALAAPRQKPEPVAYFDLQKQVFFWAKPTMIDVPMTVALNPLPLYTAPPAAAPEPVRHPGYVIGNHWLETAYSRICAGEAEADVLRDIGLVREEAFLTGVAHLKAENEALRRDAERYRWLRGEHSRIDPCIKANAKYKLERQSSTWVEIHDLDAAIDAAMQEDKT